MGWPPRLSPGSPAAWMFSSIHRRVAPGLTLAVLSASVVAALAYQTSGRLLSSGAWVEHTHALLEAIADLRLEFWRARSAARSYAINGDTSQVAPFNQPPAERR